MYVCVAAEKVEKKEEKKKEAVAVAAVPDSKALPTPPPPPAAAAVAAADPAKVTWMYVWVCMCVKQNRVSLRLRSSRCCLPHTPRRPRQRNPPPEPSLRRSG